MILKHLVEAIKPTEIIGTLDRDITSLVSDSRQVIPGSMFVAVQGVNVDGHKFIPSLSHRQLGAIVCQTLPLELDPSVTYIVVPDSASALGHLASQWYGNPSRRLRLVGVTGTNGKTTTATLIYEMARLAGFKAGLLSTVCNYVDDTPVPATQTTPDPITLNRLLAQMVECGCQYAAMEVSSHAAVQQRIAGLTFAGGIFTNLTRDHLDYHGTFDAYLAAKKSFFDQLPADAFALTNIDDKNGNIIIQNCPARHYTYSLRQLADFTGRIIESRIDGTLLALNNNEVNVMFTGRFNAYNLTAVYGASLLVGLDPETVLVNMSRLVPVAGRFQALHSATGVTAVIDYAHTPDAIVNVLTAIREIVGNKHRVITVVGAGGNRDKGKRPLMARQAGELSDSLILTSDNPRFEQPMDIIADMLTGIDTPALIERTTTIVDRAEAINHAITSAHPGDVVLIAGKGHEDYQEIQGVKHHFDDRQVAAAILDSLS